MAWTPWKKKKVTAIPVRKYKKIKSDDYKDFIDDSKLDTKKEEYFDDDPLMTLTSCIELTAKDIQLKIGYTNEYLEKMTEYFNSTAPTIKELKAEIAGLKTELRDEKEYNRKLILELINKPATPSVAAQLLAAKQAETTRTGNSSTAGPKGKLP